MARDALAREVIECFLEDIPRQFATLKDYLEAGNATGCERQAHTIKGASSNVGGEALRAAAFGMEQAAKAGDLSAVTARMPELESQFERFREAMRAELMR